MEYFNANQLFTSAQHAYRRGHSTSTALAHMTDEWLTSLDENKLVGAVLLDLTAAFDVIDHCILFKKLKYYRFSQIALKWTRTYLSNRLQQVFFNGSLSNTKTASCGLPQGSSMGPLFFSIFINDLPLSVKKAKIVMYADDVTLYSSSATITELSDTLQDELNFAVEWMKMNKLVLNKSKTKSIVFNKGVKSATNELHLSLEGTVVEQVSRVKLLGIRLDQSLSWSDQINHIVSMMGRGIAMAKKCSAFCPTPVLKTVVQSIVLSHLHYCPIVWSNATQAQLKNLQIAQNRAARLVLHCPFHTNVLEMHRKLSWLMVDTKLQVSLLMFMHTVLTDGEPRFFVDKLKFRSSCHSYSTRQVTSGDLDVPKHNKDCMKRTIVYRGAKAWNSLPLNIRDINNKLFYKKQITQLLSIM